MKVQVHTSIDSIDSIAAADWNRLAGNNPFLKYEFLAALEHSGCVSAETGWQPQHLTCADHTGRLVGAMPLYLKSHSLGEYVFDWAWAEAWHAAGLRYYPKLVCAVPFSPVTGPRLLAEPQAPRTETGQALIRKTIELAEARGTSSVHCLFPVASEMQDWSAQGFMARKDCQFHWHNRDYANFDDYLGTLSAEKRKKIRRERRRIGEAGIRHKTLTGLDMDDSLLDAMYRFYVSTYAKRGRPAYLSRGFFTEISHMLPDSLVVHFAFLDDTPIAAAICFRNADTLYGRHWGCTREFHSLHFETCYYQGIEYCIHQGLRRFEPGTQGEYKLARGFEPTATWSAHWITESVFRKFIADFLQREIHVVDAYMQEAGLHLPFCQGDGPEKPKRMAK